MNSQKNLGEKDEMQRGLDVPVCNLGDDSGTQMEPRIAERLGWGGPLGDPSCGGSPPPTTTLK